MARPERNTVDYFPFICEEGKKMYYIEETYGNDGFATFIKILRELAKTDYHYLDLSKPTTVMFLSAKCKVSKETLLSIINDLVDLDKFNLMLWQENKIIWCQDFIDGIQDAYFKRKNNCISLEGLLLLLEGLGVRKPSKSKLKVPVNTQSKVEYTKVNKTKENNNNETIANVLKSSESSSWLEVIAMQNKKDEQWVKTKIDEFLIFLLTQMKVHKSKSEFVSHFTNWLPKKIEGIKIESIKNKPFYNSPIL